MKLDQQTTTIDRVKSFATEQTRYFLQMKRIAGVSEPFTFTVNSQKTMKCESLQFDLPLYLDDALTEETRSSIDEHLFSCPLCRLRLDEYRGLRNDLRMVAKPVAPAGLLESIRNSVASEIDPPTIRLGYAPPVPLWERFTYWLMPYSVGTVAALIMTVVLFTNLGSTKNAVDSIAMADQARDRQELVLSSEFPELALEGHAPKINPTGALFALTTSMIRGEIKDEEVVIVANVFGDGLATISEIVEPVNNRKAKRELEKAFQTDPAQTPFLPQKHNRDSKAVRVVVKIQMVEVHTGTPSGES